jgi:hypothetical protein
MIECIQELELKVKRMTDNKMFQLHPFKMSGERQGLASDWKGQIVAREKWS